MILPSATWLGPVPNKTPGGMVRPAWGLILHVIVGTIPAANTVFHDPARQASAHFGVGKDGQLYQWVDLSDKAWAEGAGNPNYFSVETDGQPTEALTESQCVTLAHLYNDLVATDRFPHAIANAPGEHGFGIHSMGGQAWGGHACPGPIRAGQRQHILDLAQGSQPTEEEDDMRPVVMIDATKQSKTAWLVSGDFKTKVAMGDAQDVQLPPNGYGPAVEVDRGQLADIPLPNGQHGAV